MKLLDEFKQFALKGNVVDMATGVIIGTAFGKIVSSLVADVIMPPLGVLIGGVNFTDLSLTLKEGVDGAGPVVLKYGVFLQSVIDFTIIAFAIFLFIKIFTRFLRKEAEAPSVPPPPTPEVQLLTEIRDVLRGKK